MLRQKWSYQTNCKEFCVLECSGCKQKKRTKDRKDFECPKCNRKTTLVPRCIFQIDLIDGTATTTASFSGELGEKLLSMTAEDIFDITCAKLRKSSWGSSNNTHATLSILSYMKNRKRNILRRALLIGILKR
ncbi:hypothetical protein RDI58_019053 [Solanum bulbocastanum]|uniref:Replication factor A C-terminal domain-containing protein n=1 Tax=Solanum bulbocastanum TaxID=147425 RepID=A0AAN8TBP8_SOLBU